MIYLASPYSDPSSLVRYDRFLRTREYVWECIAAGESIFSPIVYCHQFVHTHSAGTDAATWEQFNRGMILASSLVRVLQLPGWDRSVGVQAEIALSQTEGIPLEYAPHNGHFRTRSAS